MRHLQIFVLTAGLTCATSGVLAQQPPAPPAAPAAPQRPATPATQQSSPSFQVLPEGQDARETRERLNNIFEQYPPSVREVLRIDPTLMYRADYLANYPALAAFLEQHPEIAHNPSFFVGERRFDEQPTNARIEAARALRNMIEFAGVALIAMTITTGIVILAKTILDHRRWQRAVKAQAELNTKLIDRFASSEDLLAYLQSPQGKLLTESPTLPHLAAARTMDAPLSRIFWSLQAGAVLAFAGIGMVFVSTRMTGELELARPPIFAFGTVILTIGIGFLVSSIISFLLSQRLGLVKPLSERFSGEAPGA